MTTGQAATLLTGAVLIVAGFVSCEVADAHDAIPTAAKPNGWSYPLACCSGYDCREVGVGSDIRIVEGPDGYRISTTGEVIPMLDAKVKPSPDGEFHWCSQGGRDDGETICLFVPPRGF